MNIYLANTQLKHLIADFPRQNLLSKFGVKTEFYNRFVKILVESDIPYIDEKLIELKWRILNLDFSNKFCKHCNKPTEFVSLYKGFRQYCSTSCASIHRDNSTRAGFVTKIGWDKSRATLHKRHNVYHQMHVPEIFDKQQSNRYKTYSIQSPSNLEYRVQGYERFVIPVLWTQYHEEDIIVSKKDLPKIEYTHLGKSMKYYPDAYIKSTNIIVEVKSTYTIKDPKLASKMQGCVKLGYTPMVYLWNNGSLSILSIDDMRKYTS